MAERFFSRIATYFKNFIKQRIDEINKFLYKLYYISGSCKKANSVNIDTKVSNS